MKNRENKKRDEPMKWMAGIMLICLLLCFNGCGQSGSDKNVPERVQIILISIDTLRGDHITPYGYSRDTSPNLARLVEDSVYYKNVYTNGCWTMPSHMSILTGTLPSRHGVNLDWYTFSRNKYPKLGDSIHTLSELLKKGSAKSKSKNKTQNKAKIKTIKFARLSNELGFKRGFDINKSTDPFFDEEKFRLLLDTLQTHRSENFFFFLHTWMVHAPYTHARFLESPRLDASDRENIDNFRRLSKKQKQELLGGKAGRTGHAFRDFLVKKRVFSAQHCRDLYDGGIYYVDRFLGRLTEELRRLGIYDNVMLVVVSDHGEHFEEHSPHMFYDFHGHDYFEEYVRVPLIIKYPRGSRGEQLGRRIYTLPVSLIDVVPTVLDCYNLDIPGYIQGESLLLNPAARKRKYIVSEAITGPGKEKKMLRLGNLKYIVTMKKPNKPGRVNWNRVIERRLYNLKDDPGERKNLSRTPKFAQVCQDLEAMLKKILSESTAGYKPGRAATVDPEIIEHMKTLGYL